MERKPILLACFLSVIGMICAGLIASVHDVTDPIISQREQNEKEQTILSFFNQMDHFTEERVESTKYPNIKVIYEVFDEWCFIWSRVYGD